MDLHASDGVILTESWIEIVLAGHSAEQEDWETRCYCKRIV